LKVINIIWLFLSFFVLAVQAATPERIERGALVTEGIPDIPPALATRLAQYQNARSAGLADWLRNGDGLLVTTRFGETTQLHRVAGPGAARQQLTFFEEPVYEATVSPAADVNGFVFLKDSGGSEFYQIHFFDLETGRTTLLTDGESRNGDLLWTNRGKRFAFHSTRRNGQDFDLYIGDIDSPGQVEMVLSRGGAWYVHDFSPDDASLIVEQYFSRNESRLHVLDLATGDLSPVFQSESAVAVGIALFAKDGRGIYYTSDEDSEFFGLRYRDLASGQTRTLTGDIPWDVESLALSDDGEALAFTVNEDGVSRLYAIDLEDGGMGGFPGLPAGRVDALRFEPNSQRLGMVLNTARSPGDVFTVDLRDSTLLRWTYSETGGLDSAAFAQSELVRFPTFDKIDGERRAISAFEYRPEGEGPFPVVIMIHGGPESQARPVFSAITQFLVREMDVAVIRPNVRGSTGYGKSFIKLDDGRLREDAVEDIGALLDWIEFRPELDAERVAVYGASYGGYMTLASLARYGDRLQAGVDVVGISNFVTFLENTEDYRRDMRRAEYGDEREPDMRKFLEQISPSNHATRIKRPLFIAQGLNDPRVPVSESEQMVAAIRGNGGVVWYMLANNEGHGFGRKSNRDAFFASFVLFLDRYLIDGTGG